MLEAPAPAPVPGGIAHAFNGSEQQAGRLVELGFQLGFGGAVTFERALGIRRVWPGRCRSDAIVMETDSPDIPPHWRYRTAEARAAGETMRNEPAELARIGAALAGSARRAGQGARRRDDRERARVAAASRRPLAGGRPCAEAAASPTLPEVTISESAGVRYLHLGTPWVQGAMRIDDPLAIELEYVRRMMVWMLTRDGRVADAHAVQLGLGAGAITRFCSKRLKMRTTAVELNRRVIDVCRHGSGCPPSPASSPRHECARFVDDARRRATVDVLCVDLDDHQRRARSSTAPRSIGPASTSSPTAAS